VIDLSAVDFIDSTGLGVLVGALRYYKEDDGTIALRSPSRIADRVLKVSGLNTAFGEA
jgi:anti-sigma B factor antagonist